MRGTVSEWVRPVPGRSRRIDADGLVVDLGRIVLEATHARFHDLVKYRGHDTQDDRHPYEFAYDLEHFGLPWRVFGCVVGEHPSPARPAIMSDGPHILELIASAAIRPALRPSIGHAPRSGFKEAFDHRRHVQIKHICDSLKESLAGAGITHIVDVGDQRPPEQLKRGH